MLYLSLPWKGGVCGVWNLVCLIKVSVNLLLGVFSGSCTTLTSFRLK
jgi:hypothetical protein